MCDSVKACLGGDMSLILESFVKNTAEKCVAGKRKKQDCQNGKMFQKEREIYRFLNQDTENAFFYSE